MWKLMDLVFNVVKEVSGKLYDNASLKGDINVSPSPSPLNSMPKAYPPRYKLEGAAPPDKRASVTLQISVKQVSLREGRNTILLSLSLWPNIKHSHVPPRNIMATVVCYTRLSV